QFSFDQSCKADDVAERFFQVVRSDIGKTFQFFIGFEQVVVGLFQVFGMSGDLFFQLAAIGMSLPVDLKQDKSKERNQKQNSCASPSDDVFLFDDRFVFGLLLF